MKNPCKQDPLDVLSMYMMVLIHLMCISGIIVLTKYFLTIIF